MSFAKRSMPEMTDDELLEMAMDDFNAAVDDAHAERLNPHANQRCRYCLGSGIVRDWVDYGSTVVPMDSTCDCVDCDIDPDEMTTAEAHAILRAAGYDPVEVGRRGAAVAALVMLALLEDGENGD